MDTVKQGESKTLYYNGNIIGIGITPVAINGAANAAWTTADKAIDLSQVRLIITANRRNGSRTMVTGNLDAILMASAFKTRRCLAAYGFAPYLDVNTAPGVGVAGVLTADCSVMFDDIVNLYSDESIKVDISVINAFSTTQANVTSSVFYVWPIFGEAIGTTLPMILAENVTNGMAVARASGEHTTMCAFVNIPSTYTAVPTAFPASTQLVTGLNLQSKQTQMEINQYNWNNLRSRIFQEQSGAFFSRNQNHLYYHNPSVPLTNFSANWNLTASLNANSENTIVTARRVPDPVAMQKAREIMHKLGVK